MAKKIEIKFYEQNFDLFFSSLLLFNEISGN